MKLKTLALAGVAGLALSAAAIGTASAEPNGAPQFRALSGVGSDTTQEVVNGLSDVIKDSNNAKILGSYFATGGGTIQTKAGTNCVIPRPNGSGSGRAALVKSLTPGDATAGCIDFARSSSISLAATGAGREITYVPFAIDALTYAINSGSSIPRNLTLADLKSIYRCEVPGINPLIPQAGSGTRSSFLTLLGITDTAADRPACIKDVNNGQPVQEHDGRAISGVNDIAPFSISQFIAQSFGAQTDRRGSATLGALDGKSPFLLNTNATGTREVFNIVPTAKLTTEPIRTVFVGPSSLVCTNGAEIQRFGFGINPNCGSTTQQTS